MSDISSLLEYTESAYGCNLSILTLDEKYRFRIAETPVKLKKTYRFRIVSALKFRVSAFSAMRNPRVSQISDGFRRVKLAEK